MKTRSIYRPCTLILFSLLTLSACSSFPLLSRRSASENSMIDLSNDTSYEVMANTETKANPSSTDTSESENATLAQSASNAETSTNEAASTPDTTTQAPSQTALTAVPEPVVEIPATAIDTLDTADKFTKIVLFENYTWKYIDQGRPVIDTAIFGDHWDIENIHAYKDVKLTSLPDEKDILLVDSLHGYAIPIIGKINSRYSFRTSTAREHNGTDIDLEVGDPIHAAFDGKVRVVESTRNSGGYGNLVVMRHSNGLETYYGHLSKVFVNEGDIVKAGEVIANGGNTGRSTGAHLHFETRYLGQTFDPERLFDFTEGTLRDTLITIKKHYYSIYSHNGQTDEESLAASQRVIHTIRSGDTLGALARRYQTTVTRICNLNGISSRTVLRVGRRLIVR